MHGDALSVTHTHVYNDSCSWYLSPIVSYSVLRRTRTWRKMRTMLKLLYLQSTYVLSYELFFCNYSYMYVHICWLEGLSVNNCEIFLLENQRK